MKKESIIYIIITGLLIWSCGSLSGRGKTEVTRLTVSIAPLAWIVENLTDSTIAVEVLVSPGVSPETYEPTVRQIEDLRKSAIFFSIGLIDFERQIEERLRQVAGETEFIELRDSLPLIEAECSHGSPSVNDVGHDHGADPHVWHSPKMLRAMTNRIAQVLVDKKINQPQFIYARRDSLLSVLDSLDSCIKRKIKQSGVSPKFVIVHPSLGYFARDYELIQFAIETDGKEPSGQRIKALIDTMNANNIKTIIYSKQDPKTAAEVISSQIGGRTVEFDPMARDLPLSLTRLADIICGKN